MYPEPPAPPENSLRHVFFKKNQGFQLFHPPHQTFLLIFLRKVCTWSANKYGNIHDLGSSSHGTGQDPLSLKPELAIASPFGVLLPGFLSEK